MAYIEYLNPPEQFKGFALSSTSVLWSWLAEPDSTITFELVDELGNKVADIPAGARSYLEVDLVPETAYRRRMREIKGQVASPYSDEVSVTTPVMGKELLPTPISFLGSVSSQGIEYFWKYDDIYAIDGFYLCDEDGRVLRKIAPDARHYEETTLLEGKIYRRTLKAFNNKTSSAASPVVTISLPVSLQQRNRMLLDRQSFYQPVNKITAFKSGVGDALDLLVKGIVGGREKHSIKTIEESLDTAPVSAMAMAGDLANSAAGWLEPEDGEIICDTGYSEMEFDFEGIRRKTEGFHYYPAKELDIRYGAKGRKPNWIESGDIGFQITSWPRATAQVEMTADVVDRITTTINVAAKIRYQNCVQQTVNYNVIIEFDEVMPDGSRQHRTHQWPASITDEWEWRDLVPDGSGQWLTTEKTNGPLMVSDITVDEIIANDIMPAGEIINKWVSSDNHGVVCYEGDDGKVWAHVTGWHDTCFTPYTFQWRFNLSAPVTSGESDVENTTLEMTQGAVYPMQDWVNDWPQGLTEVPPEGFDSPGIYWLPGAQTIEFDVIYTHSQSVEFRLFEMGVLGHGVYGDDQTVVTAWPKIETKITHVETATGWQPYSLPHLARKVKVHVKATRSAQDVDYVTWIGTAKLVYGGLTGEVINTLGPFTATITNCGQPWKLTEYTPHEILRHEITKMGLAVDEGALAATVLTPVPLVGDVTLSLDDQQRVHCTTTHDTYNDVPGETIIQLGSFPVTVGAGDTQENPVEVTDPNTSLYDMVLDFLKNSPVFYPGWRVVEYVLTVAGNDWAKDHVEAYTEQPDPNDPYGYQPADSVVAWYKGDPNYFGTKVINDEAFEDQLDTDGGVVIQGALAVTMTNSTNEEYAGSVKANISAQVLATNNVASIKWRMKNEEDEIVYYEVTDIGGSPVVMSKGDPGLALVFTEFTPATVNSVSQVGIPIDTYEHTLGDHCEVGDYKYTCDSITTRYAYARFNGHQLPLPPFMIQPADVLTFYVKGYKWYTEEIVYGEWFKEVVNGLEPITQEGDGWDPVELIFDPPAPGADWDNVEYFLECPQFPKDPPPKPVHAVIWENPENKFQPGEAFTIEWYPMKWQETSVEETPVENTTTQVFANTGCWGAGGDGSGGVSKDPRPSTRKERPAVERPTKQRKRRRPWRPNSDRAKGIWPWLDEYIEAGLPEDYDVIGIRPKDPNTDLDIIRPDGAAVLLLSPRAMLPGLGRWNPIIKSGYYYLNDREHYLFVKPEPESPPVEAVRFASQRVEYKIVFGSVGPSDEIIRYHLADLDKGILQGNAVRGEGYITLAKAQDGSYPPGVYISEWVEIDPNVTQWEWIRASGVIAGTGIIIKVRTKSSSGVISEWEALLNGTAPDHTPIGSSVQFMVTLACGTSVEPDTCVLNEWDSAEDFMNWNPENTALWEDGALVPVVEAEPMIVKSPVIDTQNIIDYNRVVVEWNNPPGASLMVSTMTADLPEGPWDGTGEILLQTGPLGEINSLKKRYLMITVQAAKNTSSSIPIIDKVRLDGIMGVEVITVPVLGEIKAKLTRPAGQYPVYTEIARAANITLDGKFHVPSPESMRDAVARYMLVNKISLDSLNHPTAVYNVTGPDGFAFSFSSTGFQPVAIASKSVLEEKYTSSSRFILDANNQVECYPVPQQNAPVIVYDDRRYPLRQVFFTNDAGELSLVNTETFTGGGDTFRLGYLGIDPESLTVTVGGIPVNDAYLDDHIVVLPKAAAVNQAVSISYSLIGSFYLDYNYKPGYELGLIKVYDPKTEDGSIKVIYETEMTTSYYKADEINLNPLMAVDEGRFIFISDEVPTPARIEIICNPNILLVGQDRAEVFAIVTDQYGNPVPGVDIELSVNYGHLYRTRFKTGVNGIVSTTYISPATPQTITITAVSSITQTLKIEAVSETPAGQLCVSHTPGINGTVITVRGYEHDYTPMIGNVTVTILDMTYQGVLGEDGTVDINIPWGLAWPQSLIATVTSGTLSTDIVIWKEE